MKYSWDEEEKTEPDICIRVRSEKMSYRAIITVQVIRTKKTTI